MSPGVAPERVKMMREACNQSDVNPQFLAETKKKRLELDPTGGEDFSGDRLEFPCSSRRMSSASRISLGDPEAAKVGSPGSVMPAFSRNALQSRSLGPAVIMPLNIIALEQLQPVYWN